MTDISRTSFRPFLLATLVGLFFFCFLSLPSAHAATIDFVASTQAGCNSCGTGNFTFNAATSTDGIVCMMAWTSNGGAVGSTATLNGTTMDAVGSASSTGGGNSEATFCLPVGSTTSSPYTMNWSDGSGNQRIVVVQYENVNQYAYTDTVANGRLDTNTDNFSFHASSSNEALVLAYGGGCTNSLLNGGFTFRQGVPSKDGGSGAYHFIEDGGGSYGPGDYSLTENWNGNECGAFTTLSLISDTVTVGAPGIASSSLAQYMLDHATSIGIGSSTTEDGIVLAAELTSSSSDALQLQVEVEPSSTSFTNTPTATSTVTVTSGQVASTTVMGLAIGSYHWQARAFDTVIGSSSAWQAFSTGTVDFTLSAPNDAMVEISDGSIKGLYHFDDAISGGSDVAVTDASSFAHNGRSYNNYVSSTSKFGNGLEIKSNGYVDWPATTTLSDNSSDWSYGFWIKPAPGSTFDGNYLLGRFRNGAAPNQLLSEAISCAAGHVEYFDKGTCVLDSAFTWNQNQWYWVLLERHSGVSDLWINDQFIGSGSDPYTDNFDVPMILNGAQDHSSGMRAFEVDELFFAQEYIGTSTRDRLWNGGFGAQVCVTTGCGGVNIATGTLQQYLADGTTPLGEGSSTPDNSVVFGATVNSSVTSTRLEVEWQPAGVGFMNVANASSGLVMPGSFATTSVPFNLNRSYHWQARAVDATGAASGWQIFGPSTSSIDFRVASLDNAASVYFNGSTTVGYSAASTTISATDPFTLEFWYRTAAPTSTVVDLVEEGWNSSFHSGYYVKRDTNRGIDFKIECSSTVIEFHAASSSASYVSGPTGYDAAGIWHYVAITKGNGTTTDAFHFYFDNQVQTDFPGDSVVIDSPGPISGNCFHSSSTDSIWFWRNYNSTSTPNSATGTLDEVRIWNTERSAANISSTWNQELAATGTNLMGHWSFNNTSTDLATGNSTSGQSGGPSFVSSTPFGHFLENTADVPLGVHNGQLLWYVTSSQSTQYLDELNVASGRWNALGGSVVIASTSVSSSVNVVVSDFYDSSTIVAGGYNGLSSTLKFNVFQLPTSSPPDDIYRIQLDATHELGHALGLDHSYFGNVMNYALDSPFLTTLQYQDISDYEFLYGGNE